MIIPSYLTTASQTVSPKLALDFTTASLDSRITFTRALNTATVVNSSGNLVDVNADTPRFDYELGVGGSCKGLLIEETRTNYVPNNTLSGAAAGSAGTLPTTWSVNVPTGLTRTISLTTVNGVSCIDINFTGTATSTTGIQINMSGGTSIPASNGQVWANSVWAQIIQDDPAITGIQLENWQYNSSSGFLSTGSNNNFYSTRTSFTRRTVTQTITNASTAYIRPVLRTSNNINSGTTINWTIRIGLPQMELGAFTTSVIKTSSVAVTRNADVAVMTGTNFSDWYNAAKGTFRVDANCIANGQCPIIAADDNTANNSLLIKTAGNTPTFVATTSGSQQASVTAGTITANTDMYCYSSYDAAYFGIARVSSRNVTTSGTVPTVDRLRIGANQAGSYLNGYIKKLQFWN